MLHFKCTSATPSRYIPGSLSVHISKFQHSIAVFLHFNCAPFLRPSIFPLLCLSIPLPLGPSPVTSRRRFVNLLLPSSFFPFFRSQIYPIFCLSQNNPCCPSDKFARHLFTVKNVLPFCTAHVFRKLTDPARRSIWGTCVDAQSDTVSLYYSPASRINRRCATFSF